MKIPLPNKPVFSSQFFQFFRTDYGKLVLGILLAFCAWILVEIDKEYTTFYDTDLELIPPEGYVLSRSSFEKIPIRLKGNGYELIQAISRLDSKIKISVTPENNRFSIGRSKLSQLLQNKIQSNVTLDVNLDSNIELLVDKNISKKLRVIPEIDFEVSPGYLLMNTTKLSNDSILVTGPEAILDTLVALKTEYKNLGQLSGELETSLRIKKINLPIVLEKDAILYKINIDKITEKQLEINLKHVLFPNHPDSTLVVPEKAQLNLGVPLSLYDEIDEQDIIFDYYKVQDSSANNRSFLLNAQSKNEKVIVYGLNPEEVEIFKYNHKENTTEE